VVTKTGAAVAVLACAAIVLGIQANPAKRMASAYTVLSPIIQNNLTIFPVVTNSIHDTHMFLTLDEGIRSGQVVVAEEGSETGLVRPRPGDQRLPRASGRAGHRRSSATPSYLCYPPPGRLSRG